MGEINKIKLNYIIRTKTKSCCTEQNQIKGNKTEQNYRKFWQTKI